MATSNKYKKLFGNTAIFALGSFGSKFVLFFMVPLYTNFLSREQYGTIELIDTFRQIVVPIAFLSITNALIRFGFSKFESKENVLKSSLFILVIGSVVTFSLIPLFNLYGSLSEWSIYLALYVFVDGAYELFHNYLKIKDKNLLFALSSIFQTLLFASLNIVFLAVFKIGVKGYLLSILISYGVFTIFSLLVSGSIKDIAHSRMDWQLLKKMLVYSAPLILSNLSWIIIHSSDKMMVEIIVSTAALGIYTVAAKIPSLLNVVATIFQQSWSISAIAESESENEPFYYENIFLLLQTVSFGLCIVLILIIKPFMKIYVGDDFFDAWVYIPLLLVGASLNIVSIFFGSIYNAFKKTIRNMLGVLIAAIVNLTLNFILIPICGIWGAVIGTVGAYFVILMIRLFDCNRYIRFNHHYFVFFLNFTTLLAQSILVSVGFNPYIVSSVALVIFLIVNIKSFIKLFSFLKYKFFSKKVSGQ